jgi:hypothetical protein
MQMLMTSLPCVLVSVLYCFWNQYHSAQQRQERRLRDRVAFMLWVSANRARA